MQSQFINVVKSSQVGCFVFLESLPKLVKTMKIKTTNNQILIVIIGIILSIIAGFYQISFAEVTAAEYFIDEDPGEGNGTSLPATDVFDSPQSLLW